MRLLKFLIAACGIYLASGRLSAQQHLDILVPSYANPCCQGGPTMWQQLTETASQPQRKFEIFAILNPASGPGDSRDQNYVSADGVQGVIIDFRNAGGKLLGYVSTRYDQQTDAQIRTDIDGYLKNKSLYAGMVDGIFFDELSNDLAHVARHREWVAYIESIDAKLVTVANPGVGLTINPSGVQDISMEDYTAVFDVLMSYEFFAKDYTNKFDVDPQLDAATKLRRSHVIHSAKELGNLLELAQQRHCDLLYVTDAMYSDEDPNPYDEMPSYWWEFIAAVNKLNGSQIQNP